MDIFIIIKFGFGFTIYFCHLKEVISDTFVPIQRPNLYIFGLKIKLLQFNYIKVYIFEKKILCL